MEEKAIQVKFDNRVNPRSAFDFLHLEGLFARRALDHDPYQFHRVEFFLVLLVTAGEGQHTIDFTDYTLQKGTVLTIRKDQVHKFHRGQGIKGFLLLFQEEFLLTYLEKLVAQKSLQLFNELLGHPKIDLSEADFKTVESIVSRMEAEYVGGMDAFSPGIIRSELHILITKLYRIKSQGNQIVVERKYLSEFITFQTLVEKHVGQTRRVGDYAEMMAISSKTLNTVSRSILHKSAKEFIDEIAIKQIKRLLLNTNLSIKETAYTTGFEETTNFYKYFKRHVGATPEQFRLSQ